ncbi:MAG: hypothetical protein QM785_16750 [Pyrinomonadaceae bacterium]
MNHLVNDMRKEIEKREAAFVALLNNAKQPELAATYNEIITLRHACDILATSKMKVVSTLNGVTVSVGSGSPQLPLRLATETHENGFVLRTAVRNQITQFAGKRFRTKDMYDALHSKYPEYVGESKKASVSATLANLNSMGEITKTIDGQRKVWFQAV